MNYLCNIDTQSDTFGIIMFDKDTYARRRARLRKTVGGGLIVLFGNNEAPANYPANAYAPFRQDSAFVYFFGAHRDGLVGVVDADEGTETLYGDDIDIDDIVWYGAPDSVSDMASAAGVSATAPMSRLKADVDKASASGRQIHFLPPYRHDTMLQLTALTGIRPSQQRAAASRALIAAVVAMRSEKEAQEIAVIDRACDIGYEMHTTAMRLTCPGRTERFVGGQVDGVARSLASGVSFATIFSQHGEIMHGAPTDAVLSAGRLALCDAGCELDDYCSDNTRTYPVSGTFTRRQRDIYRIVEECHDYVPTVARPGVRWYDLHIAVCTLMTQRLKELGLMRGDADEAVAAGAHALFMPHGLGHMMGMDVHDMEGLGQEYVGFDDETKPSTQFGTNCLRIGRRIKENFVLTDEPGIYFIPALIDDWKARRHCNEWIDYDAVDTYRDFGGIRIEDDILITHDGCRFLGTKRIPYHPEDVENYMRKNNG